MAKYTLADVVARCGLEVRSNGYANCPFCGDTRHKLHFDFDRDFFRCNACQASGRTLHFYARMVRGLEELPGSRQERKELSESLAEFMGDVKPISPEDRRRKERQATIHIKSDSELHTVYSALYQIPELALSKEHFGALLKRGLTPEAIRRNAYRTIPEKMSVPDTICKFVAEPESKEEFQKYQAARRKLPPDQVKAGLYLADCLVQQGFDLSGVPGFFRFRDRWCLRYIPGILIPTRNLTGQIVVNQVRRKLEPKYITLSCGGWPGAVTESVSRCHFPLGSSPISAGTSLVLTEGPLKADVAVSLSKGNLAMAAILGINATADFYSTIPALTALGMKVVLNGLDMDRLTNPNVGKGAAEIRKTLQEKGVPFQELYWGREYAEYKLCLFEAAAFAAHLAVSYPPEATVFDKLFYVSKVLWKAGLNPCSAEIGGEKISYYWETETKGIDDALLKNKNPFVFYGAQYK